MKRVSNYVCSYVNGKCTNSIALNPAGLDGQEIASVVAQRINGTAHQAAGCLCCNAKLFANLTEALALAVMHAKACFYGVTSALWDHVFRTAHPRPPTIDHISPQTPARAGAGRRVISDAALFAPIHQPRGTP